MLRESEVNAVDKNSELSNMLQTKQAQQKFYSKNFISFKTNLKLKHN